MNEVIRQRARELGFDDCRFTTAASPASAPHLQQWLTDGRHGEMTWLARNAGKRGEPQRVLPGLKSMISLAPSYAPKTNHPSDQQASIGNQKSGEVARYARFTDYHDVLAERLKALTATVRRNCSKWVWSQSTRR